MEVAIETFSYDEALKTSDRLHSHRKIAVYLASLQSNFGLWIDVCVCRPL